MFLDDELLQIGMNAELSEDGIFKAVDLMVKACFKNIQDRNPNKDDFDEIVANFQRVNKQWKMVAEKLIKANRGFVKPDGFELIIKSDPVFSEYVKI